MEPTQQPQVTTTPPQVPQPAGPASPNAAFGPEKLIGEVHKHPVGLILMYTLTFVGIGGLFVLFFFLTSQTSGDSGSSLRRILVSAAMVITVLTAIFLAISTWLYNASKLIITDKKLTQIFQQGLFKRQTSSLDMASVQDVTVEKDGILPTIFGFGTLKVETAGEEENFHFTNCPKPEFYAKMILDARENFERELHSLS